MWRIALVLTACALGAACTGTHGWQSAVLAFASLAAGTCAAILDVHVQIERVKPKKGN